VAESALRRSKTKLSIVRERMTMPTMATRKPAKKMRQPRAVNCCGVINDLTRRTEPKPGRSPIGMAKPTQAPLKETQGRPKFP